MFCVQMLFISSIVFNKDFLKLIEAIEARLGPLPPSTGGTLESHGITLTWP